MSRDSSRKKLQPPPSPLKLSSVVPNPQLGLSTPKLSLNLKDISVIDPIPNVFYQSQTVLLSQNRISALGEIRHFESIRSLSLSYNEIEKFEELNHIPKTVENLSLEGNPLTLHPGYRSKVIELFPKLKSLDGVIISPSERQEIDDSLVLAKEFIPYVISMELVIERFRKIINGMKIKHELICLTQRPFSTLAASPEDSSLAIPKQESYLLKEITASFSEMPSSASVKSLLQFIQNHPLPLSMFDELSLQEQVRRANDLQIRIKKSFVEQNPQLGDWVMNDKEFTIYSGNSVYMKMLAVLVFRLYQSAEVLDKKKVSISCELQASIRKINEKKNTTIKDSYRSESEHALEREGVIHTLTTELVSLKQSNSVQKSMEEMRIKYQHEKKRGESLEKQLAQAQDVIDRLQKSNHSLSEINAKQAMTIKSSASSVQALKSDIEKEVLADKAAQKTLSSDYERLKKQHEKLSRLYKEASDGILLFEEQIKMLMSENSKLKEEKIRYLSLIEGFEATLATQREIISTFTKQTKQEPRLAWEQQQTPMTTNSISHDNDHYNYHYQGKSKKASSPSSPPLRFNGAHPTDITPSTQRNTLEKKQQSKKPPTPKKESLPSSSMSPSLKTRKPSKSPSRRKSTDTVEFGRPPRRKHN